MSDTAGSSGTIRASHIALPDSTIEQTHSHNGATYSSDVSYPSIDSQRRYSSLYPDGASSSNDDSILSSPREIPSVVSTFPSEGPSSCCQEHSTQQLSERPTSRRGVSSGISSFRNSEAGLPGGFHERQMPGSWPVSWAPSAMSDILTCPLPSHADGSSEEEEKERPAT